METKGIINRFCRGKGLQKSREVEQEELERWSSVKKT